MRPADEARRVLRDRARALAREPVKTVAEATLAIVEFRLANERYGIETAFLVEVQPLKSVTPVPCTPAFVRGLINVRGRILAVIDLKKCFDLAAEGTGDRQAVLIVRSAELEVGLLADAVVGSRSVPLSALQPTLPTLTGIGAEYLKGVTGEGLVVLDAGKLLAESGLIVHEEVA
jgi:purine-binding chemotaxis protein CheW